MPTVFVAAVQWVASAGRSIWVSATTPSAISDPCGGMCEGRVISHRRPLKSACMKRLQPGQRASVLQLPSVPLHAAAAATQVEPRPADIVA